MAKTPDTKVDIDRKERVGSSSGVVIRDESDEVIDNLKRQLDSVRSQLAKYRAVDGAAPRPPGEAPRDSTLRQWNAGIAPYLAAKLEAPAEGLTQRLSRLIDKVSDPELRHELEQCRDTASFLFDTFRRIRDNHQLLTESLVAEKMPIAADEFCQRLDAELRGRGQAPPAVLGGRPGLSLLVASSAAGAVLSTLAELVTTLFGPPVLTVIDLSETASTGLFRLTIATPSAWDGIEGQDVSTLAFRAGMRAQTVVDLLYVEKIVELQGGSVSYLRERGRVHGLEVTWPSR